MNFLRKLSGSKRPADDKAALNSRPAKAGRVIVIDGQEESCYSAVDAESDVEPSVPVRIDWRTDPEKSLSDWKIEVVSDVSAEDETKQTTTYHVHKSVLILESEYFQSFFQHSLKPQKADGSIPSSTRLELHEKAARFFPDLLDFMYGHQPKFSSKNATIFHFFGHYFGMRRLRWEAKQFWQQDMNQKTVATYYKDAITFGDPKVMTALQETCRTEDILLGFKQNSKIFSVPDPRLWLYLVKTVGPRHSEQLSRIVAWYLDENETAAQIFLELTSPDYLPKIDFYVAFFLLELERKLFVMPDDQLTALQSRCLVTLQNYWSDVRANDPDISAFLLQQPSVFLAELYKRTLSVVQQLNDLDINASGSSKEGSHSTSEDSFSSGEEDKEEEATIEIVGVGSEPKEKPEAVLLPTENKHPSEVVNEHVQAH